MASGKEDYYFPDVTLTPLLAKLDEQLVALALIATKLETGSTMVDALDALDGTVDGLLTLGELNGSQIHTDLVANIAELVLTVAELVGVHADTSELIDYSQEDTSGTAGLGGNTIQVSSINLKRNMLRVNNNGGGGITYSRTNGGATAGTIGAGSSATFFDTAGVWLGSGANAWTAHHEWAT